MDTTCVTCGQTKEYLIHFSTGGGAECDECYAKTRVTREEWELSKRVELAKMFKTHKATWTAARLEDLSKLQAAWETNFQRELREKFPNHLTLPQASRDWIWHNLRKIKPNV